MPKKKNKVLEAALFYLESGLSIIPVGRDKKPLFPWKEFTERKPTKTEVTTWFTENPKAGVAIVTGRISNLTVIDVEKDGISDYLPATLTARTGGGGYHFYYRYTDKFKNAVRIKELTDIRNDSGYVVAPPSRHLSKRRYKFVDDTVAIAQFPSHLFLTESIKSETDNRYDEIFRPAKEGERNDRASKVAGVLLTRTPFLLYEKVAWPALQNWNDSCEKPLDEKELRAVFDSISKRVTYHKEDTEKEISDMMSMIEEHQKKTKEVRSGVIRAVTTGFGLLDSYLNGGWKPGELILIGARPSVGKTSLALTFAEAAAKAGKSVLFFSVEMASIDVFERLLSFTLNIPCSEIIKGEVEDETLAKGYKKLEKIPLEIAELSKATSVEVIELVKSQLLEKQIDLIVVDYLQYLSDRSKSDNTAVRVGKISKNLKSLARMTNIPVICPTQLNRKSEERTGKEPKLSDLRESGDLEADADIVILLDREREGDNREETNLIVAKNRKGQTGRFKLKFNLRTTKFQEK